MYYPNFSNFYGFIRPNPSPPKIYTNTQYNIRFFYPSNWVKIPGYEERYGGNDGFFQISAISGGNKSLDQVVGEESVHQLKPYGTRPMISSMIIQKQPARLILPSSDQLPEMQKQAALIVKYPSPIHIAGINYEYFILWADVSHIHSVAQTLQFLK